MKKGLLSVLILLVAIGAYAQQALWGVPQVISPEVNSDGTVTFRLKAPDAVKVSLTGSFVPNGVADFVKGDGGLWEYKSEKLIPDLYTYNYIVDGLTIVDPSNVYTMRDVCTVFNYFIVPGETSDLFAVKDVPHGTVSRVWYDSPLLDMKRRLSIYTPTGYETGAERYPVLYLLHGMGGDEEAWLTQGRAAQILDNLIAKKDIEPMIVVMPNGNPSQEAAPGETHYGLLAPTVALPHTMDGIYEESFPDIVKFVDSTYRTKADKPHRAIAGLSMGGYHSCHISKLYPDMFDYIGLFSAAVTPRENKDSEVYCDMEQKLKVQFEQQPKLYWIAIGDQDFLYKENELLRSMLDAGAYPYEYYESGGGHTWKNWRDYLVRFSQKLFK